MTEIKIFLFWLTSLEIFSLISLFIPNARRWLLRMIEDSDGDPNHTDGFFIMILWSASMCIRVAAFIAWYSVVNDKNHTDLVGIFLGFGSALLGVRAFKKKISLDNFIKDNDNESPKTAK